MAATQHDVLTALLTLRSVTDREHLIELMAACAADDDDIYAFMDEFQTTIVKANVRVTELREITDTLFP